MSLIKKIAHNTLIQIVGKIISTIFGLFAIALITRYLGLKGFGEYTTVITFLTFFAVISDFGLTLVTTQMISCHTWSESKILNNLFSLRLISSLSFLVLAPLAVNFFPYNNEIKIGVAITFIAFLFPALNQILIGLFQKKLSMERDTISEIVGRLILVLGIILSKKWQLGLNGILLSTIASTLSSFIFHYFLAFKFVFIKLEFNWSVWKEIINKSWPLTITIILNLIYLRADTLLLSLFRDAQEVGLYGATYRVIDVLASIPFMFAGLILPILTVAWLNKNIKYFKKILQKSFDAMITIVIPLIIGAQLLGKDIMIFVAGQAFSQSGEILKILIFAVAAIFLGTIFSHAIIALDKQKKMIKFYAFTSLSSLLAYLFFIPRFSYLGAAAVTIYSEVLIACFSAYCVYKYINFFPNLKTGFKALLSGIIMGIFLYLTKNNYETNLIRLLTLILEASLLYFLSLYILGGIKERELIAIFKKKSLSNKNNYNEPKL